MNTLEIAARREAAATRAASGRKHEGRGRLSTWRVLGATVAGFPAFVWQLTRTHRN